MRDYRLMIPGPVEIEDATLAEYQIQPDTDSGSQWVEIHSETLGLLKQVFRTSGDVYIIPGSGSAGLDCAIGSLVNRGDRVVVIVNGFFGERLAEIAQSYGCETVPIEVEWGKAANADTLARVLRKYNNDVKAVLVVSTESSTGVVNPVREIAALTKKAEIPIVVDAISSIGGMNIDMDGWGIDFCVGASQKALCAPPGLAFIAVSKKISDVLPSRGSAAGWYLNLRTWRRYADLWASWHPTPVTMPTNTIRALRQSLKSLFAEGLDIHLARQEAVARGFRKSLFNLGLPSFVSEDIASPLITVIRVDQFSTPGETILFLREKHGILIAGGLGPLSGSVVRIGHMCRSVSYIPDLLYGLKDFIALHG